MPRGGARQGAPGKAYSNRTDLLMQRAGQSGTNTAAAAGVRAPALPPQPMAGPGGQPMPQITPDQVAALDAPTARPNEPVTHGLATGPGGGPEALGAVPLPPSVTSLQSAYLANPTPELRRALMFLHVTPNGI